MAKNVMFPEILNQMQLRGETRNDLAKLLQLDISQISRKLRGEVQWTIGDIEVLVAHYCLDFYQLFRRNKKGEENENITC